MGSVFNGYCFYESWWRHLSKGLGKLLSIISLGSRRNCHIPRLDEHGALLEKVTKNSY